MPYCAGCGTELVAGADYCHRCGRPVKNVRVEEFTLTSEELVEKMKELVHQGNVSRVMVKDDKGNVLLDIPVTVGVVGILLAPLFAAAGAVAAVATKCTLVIERKA